MEKYVIEGGFKLLGEVAAQRSKNAVLPILAAGFLTDEEVIIENCPKISDVKNMLKILRSLGAVYRFEGENLVIKSAGAEGCEITGELSRELRSSIFLLGSILSRQKRARVAYPGGCDIGARPVDIHLNGLKKLGAVITEDEQGIEAEAEHLAGTKIFLKMPSVGATENIMLAAVKADGVTEIINAAKEPEIADLQNFLNKMGAKVKGAGGSRIYIEGVNKLNGAVYKPIADRIEAGTFLIAAAMTGGEVTVDGINGEYISPLIDKLRYSTCKVRAFSDKIYIKAGEKLRANDSIETLPYPGFPTDLQAQMLAQSCISQGICIVTENMFETRFKHISQLRKMGADITVKDNIAFVRGVESLCGAETAAADLRGGAALVLAALAAHGTSEVDKIYHIDRGYENFEEKLASLGAKIKRIQT